MTNDLINSINSITIRERGERHRGEREGMEGCRERGDRGRDRERGYGGLQREGRQREGQREREEGREAGRGRGEGERKGQQFFEILKYLKPYNLHFLNDKKHFNTIKCSMI